MNKQREVIYADRRKVLSEENLRPMIEEWVDEELQAMIATHLPGEDTANWDYEALLEDARAACCRCPRRSRSRSSRSAAARSRAADYLRTSPSELYDAREQQFGAERCGCSNGSGCSTSSISSGSST